MNHRLLDDVSQQIAHKLLDEVHSIVAAVVAAARYGTKIRLPHAFVMTFLFKRDLSTHDKFRQVLRLVAEHAANLAQFAALYKLLLALFKWTSRHLHLTHEASSGRSSALFWRLGRTLIATLVNSPWPGEARLLQATNAPPGEAEHSHHALMAGAVGGYVVWGRYSAVNYQIVLYLASRVLVGLWKRLLLAQQQQQQRDGKSNSLATRAASLLMDRAYPLAAAVVWGIVMMLFEESPEVLHPSLRSSMYEIYRSDSRMSQTSERSSSSSRRQQRSD